MSQSSFPGKSHPTIGSVIFSLCIILCMIALPIVGLIVGGVLGFVIGLIIGCIGWTWFRLRHRKQHREIKRLNSHHLTCEICGRPVENLVRGFSTAESLNIGTFLNASGALLGYEGPGDECVRCGRIYCTDCAQMDMICACGSKSFRTVPLRYR